MGTKLILNGTKLTGGLAPFMPTIDAIMPRAGALMFLDPTNPAGAWATGAPAQSAMLVNLAAPQLKLLTPAEPGSSLQPVFNYGTMYDGLRERTGKGGLHLAGTSNNADPQNWAKLEGGMAMRRYMDANRGHSFYAALWGRTTRRGLVMPNSAYAVSSGTSGNTDTWGFYVRPTAGGDTEYPTGARKIGNEGVGVSGAAHAIDATYYQDIAISSIASTNGTSPLYLRAGNPSATSLGGSPGTILYGFYAEDLTVSGRTYAEVNALLKAKYIRDVKTVGGRYYGDTYTTPSVA